MLTHLSARYAERPHVLEREARKRASSADDPTEEHTEERRAERAAYLREKLGERAESEERVEQDP